MEQVVFEGSDVTALPQANGIMAHCAIRLLGLQDGNRENFRLEAEQTLQSTAPFVEAIFSGIFPRFLSYQDSG